MRQAREAALDAQLLVLATDLGKEKASQLHAEGSAFDPSAFAEHLVSYCERKGQGCVTISTNGGMTIRAFFLQTLLDQHFYIA